MITVTAWLALWNNYVKPLYLFIKYLLNTEGRMGYEIIFYADTNSLNFSYSSVCTFRSTKYQNKNVP